ncbi:MAG: T9SS type A sorting domain-containing protein [Bacteroidota bacterium]
MRKLSILLIICLGFGLEVFGQNLVMNPSFEDTLNDCDSMHYYICQNWVNPNASTADHYNPTANLMDCWGAIYQTPHTYTGFQQAQHGNSYVGLVLYEPNNSQTKEYAQGFLTEPLVSNQIYHVAMYVNMSDSSNYKTCEIEMAFTDQLIYTTNTASLGLTNKVQLDILDTDSIDWKLITGSYTANGGEQYIYIGSNKLNSDLNCIEELSTGFVLTQAAYYLIDNVYVSTLPLSINEKKFDYKIYPNPCQNKLNIESKSNIFDVKVLDLLGEIKYENNFVNQTNHLEINISDFQKGIYYLKINKNRIEKIIIN